MNKKDEKFTVPETQPASRQTSWFYRHRRLLTTLAVVFILFWLISSWIGSIFEEKIPEVEENSVLLINPYGPVVEYNRNYISFPYLKVENETLLDFLFSLKKAAVDSRIEGVVIKFDRFFSGMAQATEMRNAILKFRESGKKIYAYADTYTFTNYYIASACDKVFIMPQGMAVLNGMSSRRIYLKETLAKLGIKAQFVKIREYKSAPERFTEATPTRSSREQTEAYLDSFYNEYLDSIAESRGVEKEKLSQYMSSKFDRESFGEKSLMETLFDLKLFDEEKYLHEVVELFKDEQEERQKIVEHKDYKKIPAAELGLNKGPRIALVYATGAIIDGKDVVDSMGAEYMGSDTLAAELRKIRTDKNIKGVVLRVDSPGGSGIASELILHEIERIRQAKKPVVVSMGNVAASGGYYISCLGDKIFAQPTTITGSIGIFAGKFDMSGLYEKIGLNKIVIKRGRYADILTETREATEDELNLIYRLIEDFYKTFLARVAEGRGKSAEEIHKIARGRVWSGRDAKKVGLIDEFGGIEEAINEVKKLAKIPEEQDVHIKLFPPRKSLVDMLLGNPGKDTIRANGTGALMKNMLPPEYIQAFSLLQMFNNTGFKIYAMSLDIPVVY